MNANESRSQLLTDILSRASRDRTFRMALLTEPRSAIYAAFGVQVPSTYRLKFIERGPDVDSLVVLPELNDDGELSDDELGAVAGGTGDPTPPPPGGYDDDPEHPLTWRL